MAKPKERDKRSILDSEQKEQIKTWVDENCLLTLNELSDKVFKVYRIRVSKSTIDRCLREFHYTVKMVTVVPAFRNSETTIKKRKEYAGLFRELEITHNNENFVFLDEVGFTDFTRPKKERSARGTGAYVDVPAVRTKIFLF
ncbi:hypothetical protein CDIK_2578 [Cucumispora dikerogammari]|nr:hypothetical protein CDIK_2578 [Cucumispora dikerogammari]